MHRKRTALLMFPCLYPLLVVLLIGCAQSFSVPHRRLTALSGETRIYNKIPSSSYPEYSVEENLDEDDDIELDTAAVEMKPAIVTSPSNIGPTQKKTSSNKTPTEPKIQFAAMEPGTVVQIQVGDVSLARKAWKKRRRSGSPLLVPCSVLNADRQSNTRWNLIYLLEKFGISHAGGIRLSLTELARRHRSHLQSSLTHQAQHLGYETARDLVEALFTKQVQDSYGVQLVLDENEANNLWLRAPLSRHRAQKRASKAVVLQFQDDPKEDDTLRHTGIVRCRKTDGEMSPSSSPKSFDDLYDLKPLSAALRVSQGDVDSGTIQNGSFHAALIYDFDPAGDAGNPLLTLSLNPATNKVRERLKIVPDRKHEPITSPLYMLKDLNVGDGPISGKVAKLVKGGAVVDCSVGRGYKTRDFAEKIKVYGILRFQDAVTTNDDGNDDSRGKIVGNRNGQDEAFDDGDEEEEENWDDILTIEDLDNLNEEDDDVEDITHLFETNQDGSLSYHDPESGETAVISMEDEDEEGDDQDDEDKKEEAEGETDDAQEFVKQSNVDIPKQLELHLISKGRPHWLHVGDQVDVFVKSVSKQSGQLQLTMDSSIQGRKAKELKKEGDVNKKLARLAKQLGGLHRIDELRGQECDGIVKATSNAGDWLYVQPVGIDSLPVGVATVPNELLSDMAKGDSVRIQIQGVDEDRGQLAMRVLSKL